MQKVFVYASYYEKCLESMGLTNEDARQIENAILENPKIGNVIPGTGGLRKFRIPINGRGKRGEKEKASIKKALDIFEKELKERK